MGADIVFPRSTLPEIRELNDYVFAGEWSFDPTEDVDASEAWTNAKAWAAYALWLEAK